MDAETFNFIKDLLPVLGVTLSRILIIVGFMCFIIKFMEKHICNYLKYKNNIKTKNIFRKERGERLLRKALEQSSEQIKESNIIIKNNTAEIRNIEKRVDNVELLILSNTKPKRKRLADE